MLLRVIVQNLQCFVRRFIVLRDHLCNGIGLVEYRIQLLLQVFFAVIGANDNRNRLGFILHAVSSKKQSLSFPNFNPHIANALQHSAFHRMPNADSEAITLRDSERL